MNSFFAMRIFYNDSYMQDVSKIARQTQTVEELEEISLKQAKLHQTQSPIFPD
jgi:hypothetical protein